jgi:UPF0176 protein
MKHNIAAYHFAEIHDAPALAATLRARAGALELRGTILVANEGINLFLAGDETAIHDFISELRDDARFADIIVKESRSESMPFARLKVKVKPEIISFRREGSSPLVEGRAPTVVPPTLVRWLQQGCDDEGKRIVLLDTRNAQEAEYGSFAGAEILPIAKFTDLPDEVDARKVGWADATVVSFCTGGIRCEKAALWMRNAAGMDNVLQLDGGILGYFEQVGGYGYEGRCFVFDGRVALNPQLEPMVNASL